MTVRPFDDKGIAVLEEKISAAADKYDMFCGADGVCAALSGGADSVALLLALNDMKERYGFAISAVHVNHHIRGEESERDRVFCEELCKGLNIPIYVENVDATGYSKERKLSLEEGARELRYNIFGEISRLYGCRIATAHTLSDSAETIIFNLARGTGLKGLIGIPPVRDNMIRPLIFCTRKDVEGYLAAKGQSFVTDSTNLSDDYTRNRIRHEIIPLMNNIHGGFEENILRMTENLRGEEAYLSMAAANARDDDLRSVHPAVRRRVIINILRENGIEVNSQRISDIEGLICGGRKPSKVNLRGNIYAFCKNGRITVKTIGKRVIFEEVPVKTGENDFLCDKKVIIVQNNCENGGLSNIVNKTFTNVYPDCDKIQGKIVLRNRRDGDKFVRAGRNFTSSLKKLMNENIPAPERDGIAILCDDEGIIWAEGFGCADRVKFDENTKRYLEIKTTAGGRLL